MSSVCRLSETFCIVAKRYVLAKNFLKEWIGNQGQKVDFWGAPPYFYFRFRHYGHPDGRFCLIGRPYYRSSLWYTLSSVCLSVCLSSVVVCNVLYCNKMVRPSLCIVAKRYVLAKNCLKEWIGNQGQKVDFLGRRHISTSSFAATATETAVFALFLSVQPSNQY